VSLVELLQRGECLAIFPEGTTTDGTKVAHFHASLLQPAIDAGAQVHPIAIRYQDSCGALSMASAYIDEMSFGASMWNILSTPELHVRLVATSPLDASGTDRRNLTRTVQHHISTALNVMHAAPMMPPHAPAIPEHVHAQAEAETHFQSLYCVLLYPSLTQDAAQQTPR
jgi:1-acyl-sn-glycerol-3-phosphate acyltransferase